MTSSSVYELDIDERICLVDWVNSGLSYFSAAIFEGLDLPHSSGEMAPWIFSNVAIILQIIAAGKLFLCFEDKR